MGPEQKHSKVVGIAFYCCTDELDAGLLVVRSVPYAHETPLAVDVAFSFCRLLLEYRVQTSTPPETARVWTCDRQEGGGGVGLVTKVFSKGLDLHSIAAPTR
ncbi:unnamed protein product [Ectocarpus sp. 8 AP-2014]